MPPAADARTGDEADPGFRIVGHKPGQVRQSKCSIRIGKLRTRRPVA